MAPLRQKAWMLALIGLAICGVMSVFGWRIARSITRPLHHISTGMNTVAAGDLSTEVAEAQRGDEIGDIGKALLSLQDDLRVARTAEEGRAEQQREQEVVVENLSTGLLRLSQGDFSATIDTPFSGEHEKLRTDFNTTVTKLNDTLGQVVTAIERIRNGAAEINQSSDDLSHRTESQAATLEETAAALEEITASVKSAADGARSVEQITGEAKQEAEVSGQVVQNAVAAMTEIEHSSKKIEQIISVIDDIAFQTNLLALNAGVEAARAGEAGRGFAVVASEVRGLAQRSSDAAMEIKALIGESSKQVDQGVDLVGKAGEALETITKRVNHISQLISGIAEGAAEQSNGIEEINTGMVQLDQVTQQNAAMVEEASAACQMLDSDASELGGVVANFRLAGKPAAPTARTSPRPQPPMPTTAGTLTRAGTPRTTAVMQRPVNRRPTAARAARRSTTTKTSRAPGWASPSPSRCQESSCPSAALQCVQGLGQQRAELRDFLRRKPLYQVGLGGHMCLHHLIDQRAPLGRQGDQKATAVFGVGGATDQPVRLKAVNPVGHGTRGHHRRLHQCASRQAMRRPGPPQCGEHVELGRVEAKAGEGLLHRFQIGEAQSAHPTDHSHRRHIEVWAFAAPLIQYKFHMIHAAVM